MSQYGVIFGAYFPLFGLNTGKYGPEITPHLGTFQAVKTIHILHSRYHPKILEHILKNKQKSKFVCIHEILLLIIMKMKMKQKNRSYRYLIDVRLDMNENIVNIQSVLPWHCVKTVQMRENTDQK